MPHLTELKWAMEICRQQGYTVIQNSRIYSIYVRNLVNDYDGMIARKDPKFWDYLWRTMLIKLVEEIEKEDKIVKCSRRQQHNPYPPLQVDYRSYGLVPQAITQKEEWGGYLLQSRITVLEQ
jgi:hypothetical protein